MPIKRKKDNGDFMSRQMDERLQQLEASISNIYAQATADAQRRLNDYLSQYEERDRAMYARMVEGEITEADYRRWRERSILYREHYAATVDNLTDVLVNADIAAIATVNGDLPYVLAQSFNFGQFAGHLIADREQTPNVSFQIYNAQSVQALIRDNPDLLPSVNIPEDERWNRTHINRELTQAIIGGDSIPRIAQRLARVVHMDENSAVRAARTSMTAAENLGRNESHRRITAQGINMVKRWSATYDGRTRATHRLLDNTTANKDGKFGEGILDALGEPLMEFPADPAGAAAERYNCRCRLNIVPPEYSREATAREYEQWLRNNYPEDYAALNESSYFDRLHPNETWRTEAQQEFDRRVERLRSQQATAAPAFTPTTEQLRYEESILNNDHEAGAYFDKDGNLLLTSLGGSNEVEFDPYAINRIEQRVWNGEQVDFTHNHPLNTVFSPDDIENLETMENNSCSAVLRNGTTYRLIRNQPQTSNRYIWDEELGDYRLEFEPLKIADKYDEAYMAIVNSRQPQRGDFATHAEWRQAVDAFFGDELTPEMEAWLRENAEKYGYIFIVERRR